jgi:hypothetical protein
MNKHIKYPFTAIMIVILIIGMPITIGYLHKESHKGEAIFETSSHTPSPSIEPSATPEATPAPATPSDTDQTFNEQGGMEDKDSVITPPHKPTKSYGFVTVPNQYFDDALFIGDSRTVGLSEYAPFSGATYFASIGMSAHSAMCTKVSMPSIGKLTLTQLLKSRSFGKVYIMLGINELGYRFDSIISAYTKVLETIKQLQPDAIIYIEANLHVTKSKSDGDNIINNKAIDNLNESLSELADGKSIFYIDVNEKFDDENGNLADTYTSDNAHLLGKYYADWGQWICKKAIQK